MGNEEGKRRHRGDRERSQRQRPKPNATPDDMAFGVNACTMALQAGVMRRLLYLAESVNPRVVELVEAAESQGVTVEGVSLDRLDQLSGGGVHQGVLTRLRDLPEADLRAIASGAVESSLVLLLDGITDPQNVGAVMRTAVAIGVDAVVIPRRRGAQLTPGVHRASAGLSFLAPVAAPQNLSQALDTLKDAGYWIAAAAGGEGAEDATRFDWPAKTGLVVGSEGEGVSSLLLRRADFRVALPMDPRVESLNVGVATGALAYLWRRQWPRMDGARAGDAPG